MRSHLKPIRNLPELAEEANWSAAALAKRRGLSLRCLERAFQTEMGTTVRAWLQERRQCRAVELLREGFSVKEVSAELGYSDQSHLWRAFRQRYGRAPSVELKAGAAQTRKRPACREMA